MKKVSPFDVFKAMVDRDMKSIQLASLNNITELRKVKAGTKVTIGVGIDCVADIYHGKYCGGLILCEKADFDHVKKELEGA